MVSKKKRPNSASSGEAASVSLVGRLSRFQVALAAVAAILVSAAAIIAGWDQLLAAVGLRPIRASVSGLAFAAGDVIRVRVTNQEKEAISVAAGAMKETRRGSTAPSEGDVYVDAANESTDVPAGATRAITLRARMGGATVDFPHAEGDDCRLSLALELNAAGRNPTTIFRECPCPP
ncbi:MAG: hypothetical protein QOJ98_1380 [Acidobacteriota bacterium]|jgi:hypothetical protein|nr:hypothetical protein [Acidobacteriota bacterium]